MITYCGLDKQRACDKTCAWFVFIESSTGTLKYCAYLKALGKTGSN